MSAFTTPLSDDEKSNFNRSTKIASVKCQDEVARIREEYNQQNIDMLVETGMDKEVAIKAVNARLEHTLLSDDSLVFDNFGSVTVTEVLSDSDKYDGQSLADPLEPEKGKGKAKFYANKATSNPIVHSFVHGGTNYHLIGNAYQLFNMQHASGMIKGKFRIARKENNKLTFVTKGDLINHYAGISTDDS